VLEQELAPPSIGHVPRAERGAGSLYDEAAGIYAFLRERVFRDDTERIVSALWTDGRPGRAEHVVEAGCGPGLYARQLAARFPHLRVTGIDRSREQIRIARSRAAAESLERCEFAVGDARELPLADGSVDAVIASRLLSSVPVPSRIVAELRRVLRPGGRCFIAEPRYRWQLAVPLAAMRAAAGRSRERRWVGLAGAWQGARTLDGGAFRSVVASAGWSSVEVVVDGLYQYATAVR
jgi:SAM-dependent methyltransferase